MNPSYLFSEVRVFFRSFLIQAFWNFERIQNIGFAYCIYPFLVNLYPDKEKRKEAIIRHLEFFCTHPYMVNILLGLVVSMEERLARGDQGITGKQISQIKSHLAGPLAALGDSFFWVTWRSLCAIIAASIYFFSANKIEPAPAFLAVFLFLILYNMVHIPVRWFGFSLAYKQGIQIIATIERFRVLNWGRMIAPVIMTLLILMVCSYFIVIEGGGWHKLLLAGFFFALFGFKHKETSTIKVVYFTILICVLLSYIGATTY
ncbi:MAG: PTS system mannose/fructose/sorbose family transporter subunit IID [bacterium]